MHQSCYGISELPGPEEVWLCRACESREERDKVRGGANCL